MLLIVCIVVGCLIAVGFAWRLAEWQCEREIKAFIESRRLMERATRLRERHMEAGRAMQDVARAWREMYTNTATHTGRFDSTSFCVDSSAYVDPWLNSEAEWERYNEMLDPTGYRQERTGPLYQDTHYELNKVKPKDEGADEDYGEIILTKEGYYESKGA